MNKSFSERQGIISPKDLNINDMPIELRNRLWNITQKYINDIGNESRANMIKYLWDRFFKQDIDTLNNYNGYFHIDQIKKKFYQLEWNKVYDFLEFLLSVNTYKRSNFIYDLNLIFVDERAQYKIIDNIIIPLMSEEEVEEIEKAIESKYADASKHIKKALELYRKRPVADYHNSIKESISSIEELARIVLNSQSATLGKLADQLNVHPAFKEAIKKLYGWTCDEKGVRHSGHGEELKIDEKEARYMLVQCSALLNYIISKYEK